VLPRNIGSRVFVKPLAERRRLPMRYRGIRVEDPELALSHQNSGQRHMPGSEYLPLNALPVSEDRRGEV